LSALGFLKEKQASRLQLIFSRFANASHYHNQLFLLYFFLIFRYS